MKLSYVALMRWRPGDQEPIMLGSGAELSDYSFFQRGSIKEFMGFTSKTVVRRTQVGARQTVKAQAYMCHVIVRDSHLACAVFCDEEYPSRAAMAVAMSTIQDFEKSNAGGWKTAEVDNTEGQALCEQALIKYKDPASADKLTRVQNELDKTKAIMHQTIESVLDRGEKLDDLVNKSDQLSYASKQFYKQARKTNSCWGINCSMS